MPQFSIVQQLREEVASVSRQVTESAVDRESEKLPGPSNGSDSTPGFLNLPSFQYLFVFNWIFCSFQLIFGITSVGIGHSNLNKDREKIKECLINFDN